MKDRQPYNKVLVEFMKYLFDNFQDVRFFQVLMNVYKPIMDETEYPFHQEPWETLERLEKRLKKSDEVDLIEKLNELKEIHLQ